MNELLGHHAHLWIGNQDILVAQAIKALQSLWCSHNGCGQCSVCKRVLEKQYHNLLWLTPAKQSYTVDQIDELHEHLTLQRDVDEHFFVVFEAAQALSAASANKLLKTLEEPPAGYHFLLLSESRFALLPTIVSRCLITQFGSEAVDDGSWVLFVDRILSPDFDLHTAFQQMVALRIDETKTRVIIDFLLQRIMARYHDALIAGDTAQAQRMTQLITLVDNAYTRLPMPGSTNSFWRTLFLQITCLKKT
jgi:DNA polymerase-3 subunit delta'